MYDITGKSRSLRITVRGSEAGRKAVTIKRAPVHFSARSWRLISPFSFSRWLYFPSLVLTFFVCIPLCVRLTYKSVIFALVTFVAQRKSSKFLFNLSALALFPVLPLSSISRCPPLSTVSLWCILNATRIVVRASCLKETPKKEMNYTGTYGER